MSGLGTAGTRFRPCLEGSGPRAHTAHLNPFSRISRVRFGHDRYQVPAVSLRAMDLAVLLAVRKELPSLFEPCLVHEDGGGAGL